MTTSMICSSFKCDFPHSAVVLWSRHQATTVEEVFLFYTIHIAWNTKNFAKNCQRKRHV